MPRPRGDFSNKEKSYERATMADFQAISSGKIRNEDQGAVDTEAGAIDKMRLTFQNSGSNVSQKDRPKRKIEDPVRSSPVAEKKKKKTTEKNNKSNQEKSSSKRNDNPLLAESSVPPTDIGLQLSLTEKVRLEDSKTVSEDILVAGTTKGCLSPANIGKLITEGFLVTNGRGKNNMEIVGLSFFNAIVNILGKADSCEWKTIFEKQTTVKSLLHKIVEEYLNVENQLQAFTDKQVMRQQFTVPISCRLGDKTANLVLKNTIAAIVVKLFDAKTVSSGKRPKHTERTDALGSTVVSCYYEFKKIPSNSIFKNRILLPAAQRKMYPYAGKLDGDILTSVEDETDTEGADDETLPVVYDKEMIQVYQKGASDLDSMIQLKTDELAACDLRIVALEQELERERGDQKRLTTELAELKSKKRKEIGNVAALKILREKEPEDNENLRLMAEIAGRIYDSVDGNRQKLNLLSENIAKFDFNSFVSILSSPTTPDTGHVPLTYNLAPSFGFGETTLFMPAIETSSALVNSGNLEGLSAIIDVTSAGQTENVVDHQSAVVVEGSTTNTDLANSEANCSRDDQANSTETFFNEVQSATLNGNESQPENLTEPSGRDDEGSISVNGEELSVETEVEIGQNNESLNLVANKGTVNADDGDSEGTYDSEDNINQDDQDKSKQGEDSDTNDEEHSDLEPDTNEINTITQNTNI